MWKQIYDFCNYEASIEGLVRNKRTRRLLAQVQNRNGYLVVGICRNGKKATKTIHRLVATAFHGYPGIGFEVNHKDGNKKNNKADNLEWVSHKENDFHARKVGLKKGNTPVVVQVNGSQMMFYSIREAAIHFGLHQTQLWRALKSGMPYKGIYFVRYLDYNAPKPEFRDPKKVATSALQPIQTKVG